MGIELCKSVFNADESNRKFMKIINYNILFNYYFKLAFGFRVVLYVSHLDSILSVVYGR